MKSIGRLMAAFVVLIAQMSVGFAVCACPISPEPVPKQVECPMGMSGPCQCCHSAAKASNDQSVKAGACRTQVTDLSEALPATLIAQFQAPAILQPTLVIPRPVLAIAASVPQHLRVPRIRPPDPGLHGLRAPPAR